MDEHESEPGAIPAEVSHEETSEQQSPVTAETRKSEIMAAIEAGEPWSDEKFLNFYVARQDEIHGAGGDQEFVTFGFMRECGEIQAAGGKLAEALETMQDLAESAYQAGEIYDEFVDQVRQRITELEALSKTENEVTEPTSTELANACRTVLDEESIVAIEEVTDPDDALGLTIGLLTDAGVDDPNQFLIDGGLYTSSRPLAPDGS